MVNLNLYSLMLTKQVIIPEFCLNILNAFALKPFIQHPLNVGKQVIHEAGYSLGLTSFLNVATHITRESF